MHTAFRVVIRFIKRGTRLPVSQMVFRILMGRPQNFAESAFAGAVRQIISEFLQRNPVKEEPRNG